MAMRASSWARSPRSRQGEGRNFEVGGQAGRGVPRPRRPRLRDAGRVPAQGGPLADGLVGGGTLVCPLHDWRFDLATGRRSTVQCSIAVYPVRTTEDREILLTIDGA